jgi:aerobic carbon-monoxide dehydrogenase large subunit
VAQSWIGRSLPRREDDHLLRGAGRFVADLDRPGQLCAHFVRSPVAHARLLGIDATAALALPGVAGVFTALDLPAGTLPPFLWDTPPEKLVAALHPQLRPCHPPLLAADRVRFAGQAVGVVLAVDRYLAEDAAELVEVDYDPLPAVTDPEAALAPEAPLVHDGWDDNVAVRFEVRHGDAEGALAAAEVVVRERFSIQRQAPLPLETRAALADHDPDGLLTLWSTTQNAHPLRRAVSRVAGLAPERIRVVAPDVGGGFGGKGVLYPEDLIVALLALRTGWPVKWVEDRAEHLRSAIHAREQVHDVELGLDRDGRLLALRDRFLVDSGAYNPLGLVIPYNTIAHLQGPYRVAHLEAVATAVLTNKVPAAPYRGAGRPEAVFAVERAIERAARALGLDPLELRLRNLLRPDELPFRAGILYRDGEPLVLDGGDYPAALRRAAELADYAGAKARGVRRAQGAEGGSPPAGQVADGRRVGVGVACYVEGTGIGPFEGAAVRVEHDGRVLVRTGACSQGQGHATVLAQVCAERLGVDPSVVSVVSGDTAGLERGWGTVASRSAVVAGNAVAAAALAVRAQAVARAATMLEVAEADLVVEHGRVAVAGAPERGLDLGELAGAAEAGGAELAAVDYFEPPTVTWANGAHAAVVEVDPGTGEVHLLRYAVVHDCGRPINPAIVDGQVHGGVAQGIGGALFEELVYDDEGQLLSGTLADYLVPTAADMPPIALAHAETPSPLNPLGVKGVGEGGAIPGPAAIANAVEDALAPSGQVVRRTPLSPAYVRSLLG